MNNRTYSDILKVSKREDWYIVRLSVLELRPITEEALKGLKWSWLTQEEKKTNGATSTHADGNKINCK